MPVRQLSEAMVNRIAAGEVVEHADLFDHPERVIKWQCIDHRPEAKPLRALRDGGKKDARRWRHSNRRRMVLSEMVAVEPGPIIAFNEFETILVIVAQWQIVAIEMIKYAKLHFSLSLSCVCGFTFVGMTNS